MRRDAEREIKELDKRKECLRQEVEEMEAATPSLSEGVRTLWKARSDGSREEGLGSAIEGLRGRISDLSSQIADCNGRAEGIERGLPALRARYRELAERFNDTRSRVEQALGRLREVPNTLSELAQDIARKLGKPLFDPDSLDYLTREVTRRTIGRPDWDKGRWTLCSIDPFLALVAQERRIFGQGKAYILS